MQNARPEDDAGESLLEIVISVMMVAVAVAMIISAVASGTNLTLGHKRLVNTDTLLKQAAEAVKATAYVAGPAAASSYAAVLPSGVSISLSCIDGAAGDQSAGAAHPCSPTLPKDIQLVTLTAAGSDTSEQATIAKRNG